MDPVSLVSSYKSISGETVPVEFTKKQLPLGEGREGIIYDHPSYEVRLFPVDIQDNRERNSKIVFNAQITAKSNGIVINAPVVAITSGDHSGVIMIGHTASFRKNRALLTKYVDAEHKYDQVTMPYSEYMIIETMLRDAYQTV